MILRNTLAEAKAPDEKPHSESGTSPPSRYQSFPALLALLKTHFPGPWLPEGTGFITDCPRHSNLNKKGNGPSPKLRVTFTADGNTMMFCRKCKKNGEQLLAASGLTGQIDFHFDVSTLEAVNGNNVNPANTESESVSVSTLGGKILRDESPYIQAMLATMEQPTERGASPERGANKSRWVPQLESLAALGKRDIPQLRWAIDKLLPEGAALLVAKPKAGKSFLALQLGILVASGINATGFSGVNKGSVLYLALEDSDRRIKTRAERMCSVLGVPLPENFILSYNWAPGPDGIDAMEQWLENNPDARLVVVDILQKVRSRRIGNQAIYQGDYDDITPFKALAMKYHVALLIVHHSNKSGQKGVAGCSGSYGLPGAADTYFDLDSTGSNTGELSMEGRDIDRQTLSLRFEKGIWYNQGHAGLELADWEIEIHRAILAIPGPAPLATIQNELPAENKNTLKVHLHRMVSYQRLDLEKGVYSIPESFQAVYNDIPGVTVKPVKPCNRPVTPVTGVSVVTPVTVVSGLQAIPSPYDLSGW